MGKLLVVDGSNLLFQMFFGMPARILGRDGTPIQGVVGFLGALRKLVKMVSPTHLLVLFDGEHHNPRCDLDCTYKANRPDFSALPDEENPFTQLPHIQRALAYLGIPTYETVDCETDDIIASYAKGCPDGMEVIISSFDSDFFQLISPSVKVIRYRGEQSVIWDEVTLKEKLGVTPKQYADYKAMVGDHADNISGIPGVGPKTAVKLLTQYGSLDGIYSHIAELRERQKETLLAHKERIPHNLALIVLDGSHPLPIPYESLAYTYPPLGTRDVLMALGVM